MTACPCAQELAARSRGRLAADGFTDDEIERVLVAVPVATHNQRGIGRFTSAGPGRRTRRRRPRLPRIVEQSMARDLRADEGSDEVEVVEGPSQSALRRGLREMVRRVPTPTRSSAPAAPSSPARRTRDDPPPLGVAERSGLLSEIVAELERRAFPPPHDRARMVGGSCST
jgi:GTP cyclohydrolase I/GTP cyclohydrolase-4